MPAVKDDLKELLRKLRGEQKAPEPEEIPEGYVRCVRCKRIVRKDRATIDLDLSGRTKEIWVCDECYFGHAQ